jgi:hypothetical protein
MLTTFKTYSSRITKEKLNTRHTIKHLTITKEHISTLRTKAFNLRQRQISTQTQIITGTAAHDTTTTQILQTNTQYSPTPTINTNNFYNLNLDHQAGYFFTNILIGDKATIDLLKNIAIVFSSFTLFTFYTDGSLINLATTDCKMGIGWIETTTTVTHPTTFKAATSHIPSSTKAEGLAILTTLLVVPNGSKITVYTDSQNCIHNFNKITNPLTSQRQILKIKNNIIWQFIHFFLQSKHLNL